MQEPGHGRERQAGHPAAAGGGPAERCIVRDDEAAVGGDEDVDFEARAEPPAQDEVAGPERRLGLMRPRLVPLEPDRPARPVDRHRHRRGRDSRHTGGPTRTAVSRRSVAVSNTSESCGAKPTFTGAPAASAAADPCSSTRTSPTSVLTT